MVTTMKHIKKILLQCMRKPSSSIGFKLISANILLLFITIIVILNITQFIGSNTLREQVLSDLSAVATSKADQVASFIEQDFERAALVASRTQLRWSLVDFETDEGSKDHHRDRMIAIIQDAKHSVSAIRNIDILTLDGTVAASTDVANIGRNDFDKPWFASGLSGMYQDSFQRNDDTLEYALALPLLHPESETERVIGVVKVDISLERLIAMLTDYTGLGETGETILAAKENDIIRAVNPLRHDSGGFLKTLEHDESSHQSMNSALQGESGELREPDYRGIDTLNAYRSVPIDHAVLGLLVKMDNTEIFAPVERLNRTIFYVGSILLILSSIVALKLVNSITKPIKQLQTGAEKIGGRELNYRLKVQSQDEIGQLTSYFNEMAESLQETTTSRDELEREVCERRKVEESLHSSTKELYKEKEQFKTTLLSVGDGIISTDKNGKVLIINPITEQLTGWTKDEAIGNPIEEVFCIVDEYTRERCENPVQKVLETGNIIELDNHTMLISKDGIERPIEDSAAPIKDEEGNITGVVLVFRDFTEKKKSQDDIKYLSFHDHLTGLYNRRFFEAELKRLDTKRNLPLTIVMGDVNGLKLINDSFGHATGDQLLIKAAEAIKKGCRADDIIARIGGDEFVILLPKTDGFEAEQLIKRMKGLSKKERVGDVEISISFGCETKKSEAEEIESILKKAEDKMYNNKLFEGPSIRGKVIHNIINTLNKKSKREEAHSKRVSEICERMGDALGLKENKIKELKAVGQIHDIGKIVIADDVLNKPGKLTDDEWAEMKRHAETGYRILSTANDMSEMAEYVLYHHERWDGKGYPKGLKGEAIPLESRIIAIADAYDAMTSDRPYREAISRDAAIEEIRKNAGTQFDPELVEIFLSILMPSWMN